MMYCSILPNCLCGFLVNRFINCFILVTTKLIKCVDNVRRIYMLINWLGLIGFTNILEVVFLTGKCYCNSYFTFLSKTYVYLVMQS